VYYFPVCEPISAVVYVAGPHLSGPGIFLYNHKLYCVADIVRNCNENLTFFQVTCIGQLIGLVIAKTRPLAQRAAKLVITTYKDLPAIITIEVRLCILLHNIQLHIIL